MADDEFVIGFSDSEWTGIGPILEEDVAISSLAQDELGHAQALYRLLAELVADGRDADAIAYDRPPEGYFHARLLDHPRGDWAQTIARRYLYDTADAARLAALADVVVRAAGRARRQDPPRGALPPDARRDVARAAGRRRRRAAATAARRRSRRWARTPGRCSRRSPGRPALVRHGILGEPFAAIEARWRAAIDADVRPARAADAAADRGPTTGRGPVIPTRSARSTPSSRWSAGARPGRRGDLTARDACRPPTSGSALADRPRPGDPDRLDRRSRARPRHPRRGRPDRVELLPTFVACPALEVIRVAVVDAAGRRSGSAAVDVAFTFDAAVDDRPDHAGGPGQLPRGRDRPPPVGGTARCSSRSSMRRSAARSATRAGRARQPVRAGALPVDLYCRDCRQPFEAFKPI